MKLREIFETNGLDLDDAVRVESLRAGTRFRCVLGLEWVLLRQDGALAGVYHARRDNGFESCFAGCAEVEVL